LHFFSSLFQKSWRDQCPSLKKVFPNWHKMALKTVSRQVGHRCRNRLVDHFKVVCLFVSQETVWLSSIVTLGNRSKVFLLLRSQVQVMTILSRTIETKCLACQTIGLCLV
jgi:hypothetical protein